MLYHLQPSVLKIDKNAACVNPFVLILLWVIMVKKQLSFKVGVYGVFHDYRSFTYPSLTIPCRSIPSWILFVVLFKAGITVKVHCSD